MLTLQSWLDKIERIHPTSIELGLDRVREVAEKLQVLDWTCPVILVGGTNGKGSCVKFLESILVAEGYQVGAYTSPHLLRFNERICLNGIPVEDADLIAAFERVEYARENITLTYFEFTTLAALVLFKKQTLNVIILEIGLGGRLDAVNILDADLAIISTIDLDHTDWLGNTRESIALEKAGIIRPQQPVVVGDEHPPATLLDYATHLNANLYCVKNDFDYEVTKTHWDWKSNRSEWKNLPLPKLPIANAATTLMALTLLNSELPVSERAIHQGLADASISGRFQVLTQPFHCILDVAHNPASAKLLATQCRAFNPSGTFHAVVGMLKDKDIANTLMPLASLISCWHFGSLAVPRGASASLLASQVEKIDNEHGYFYDDIIQAFKAASKDQSKKDTILVFGSFYTVATVLTHISTL